MTDRLALLTPSHAAFGWPSDPAHTLAPPEPEPVTLASALQKGTEALKRLDDARKRLENEIAEYIEFLDKSGLSDADKMSALRVFQVNTRIMMKQE